MVQMTEKNPPTAYDSPWKDILQTYFEEFILFFFPNAHTQIDWTKQLEFLDKELEEVVKDAEIGRRFADKLVKVYLTNGSEEWILIHVEVQSQQESDFAERIYIYNSRIYNNKYKKSVISIAVLGDDNAKWHPSQFGYSLFGCVLYFKYPIIKLLDYQQQQSQLSASRNPFATVVMAHLAALNTRSDRTERKRQKLALVQRLYSMGLEEQEVLNLLAFVDWMLTLPLSLEQEFKREVEQLEAGQRMKYVTSFERIARKEELLQAIELGLEIKFGATGLNVISEISQIDDIEQLRAIRDGIKTVTSVSELQRIYQPPTE